MSYEPRPGSKTAAAIDYLRQNGGIAPRAEMCNAADIDTKNMLPILQTAIDHGVIEYCKLEDGTPAVRICDAAPADANRNQALASLVGTTKAVPARRGRSVIDGQPAKGKRTVRQIAKRPRLPDAEAHNSRRRAQVPPPVATPDEPFRCGFFSDGTLRLEGCNLLDGTAAQVTLSTAAAKVLASYLREHKS